jgi:hypothetical protein
VVYFIVNNINYYYMVIGIRHTPEGFRKVEIPGSDPKEKGPLFPKDDPSRAREMPAASRPKGWETVPGKEIALKDTYPTHVREMPAVSSGRRTPQGVEKLSDLNPEDSIQNAGIHSVVPRPEQGLWEQVSTRSGSRLFKRIPPRELRPQAVEPTRKPDDAVYLSPEKPKQFKPPETDLTTGTDPVQEIDLEKANRRLGITPKSPEMGIDMTKEFERVSADLQRIYTAWYTDQQNPDLIAEIKKYLSGWSEFRSYAQTVDFLKAQPGFSDFNNIVEWLEKNQQFL